MENPATWGRAEQIIRDEMQEWENATANGFIGQSLCFSIAQALRAAGLLKLEPGTPDKPNHYVECPEHGLRLALVVPGLANDYTCVDCI